MVSGGYTAGLVAAIAAAGFNGSFLVPFKSKRVEAVGLDPYFFLLLLSCGVLGSCLLSPLLLEEASWSDGWSVLGGAGGAVFASAVGCNLVAVRKAPLSIVQGVVNGTAILVSFGWGVLVFDDTVTNSASTSLGLLLLLSGTAGIANCKRLGASFGEAGGVNVAKKNDSEREGGSEASAQGLLLSVLTGMLGGSVLVPLKLSESTGLSFLPSFGVGAILAASLIATVAVKGGTAKTPPGDAIVATAAAGIFSGCLWNCGNILSAYATEKIGYSLAYPLFQCALLVSGIWGIFLFGEFDDEPVLARNIFYASGGVLLSGAALLAVGLS